MQRPENDVRLDFIQRSLRGVRRRNRKVIETIREVIALGKYLRRLKQLLTPLEWKQLTHSKEFDLSNSTATRLMKIASCPRILCRDNWPFLPQTRSTLYEVYHLTDEQWEHGITTDRNRGDADQHGVVEKLISPDTTVKELQALGRWHPPPPPSDDPLPTGEAPKDKPNQPEDGTPKPERNGVPFDLTIHLEGRTLPGPLRHNAERLIEILEETIPKLKLTLDIKTEIADSIPAAV